MSRRLRFHLWIMRRQRRRFERHWARRVRRHYRRRRLDERLDFWEARAMRNPWNDPAVVWTPYERNMQ